MSDTQMQFIGEIEGKNLYFADSGFANPGVYYWDGKDNIRIWPLSTTPEPQRQAQGDGMLPDALVPHAKEWYRLCERRYSVERMTISGGLAEAIVDSICRNSPQSPHQDRGEVWPLDRCLEHPRELGYVDIDGFKRWVALNPGAVSQLIISLFNELPLDTIRPAVIAALTEAKQQGAGEAVAWSVLEIGNRGAAYDLPNTKRAFTYDKQPGNVDASKLGRAADTAANMSAGDSLDRGLALLKTLQNEGFGVFQIGPEYPPQGEAKRNTGEVVECQNCGSTELTWEPHMLNKSGVADGRLRMHDVSCSFVLGCDHCSETVRVVDAGAVAAMLPPQVEAKQQMLAVIPDYELLKRWIFGIGIIGQVNGRDVVLRDSVNEMLDRWLGGAPAASEGDVS